nr:MULTISPECIES: PLD nuclease N-terminal domain-containing protein [Microbacterium]
MTVLLLPLLLFALLLIALIDVITRREDQVNHLPKFGWVLLIVLLPVIGSILWITLGREWGSRREPMSFGDPRRWAADAAAQPSAPSAPHSTEAQLAALEREIEIAALEEEIRRRRAAAQPLDPEPGGHRS